MTNRVATQCHNLNLHDEAQLYFKRVIDSKLGPVDFLRLFLASSYLGSGKYYECREVVVPLLSKCIYDTPKELLDSFKEKRGACLHEEVYSVVFKLSHRYYVKGQELDSKGDELLSSEQPSGEY